MFCSGLSNRSSFVEELGLEENPGLGKGMCSGLLRKESGLMGADARLQSHEAGWKGEVLYCICSCCDEEPMTNCGYCDEPVTVFIR